MKRARGLALVGVAAFLLSGCAAKEMVQERVKEQICKTAGIYEQEDYRKYEQQVREGALDENGLHKEENEPKKQTETGLIHVTFAENANLLITYYSDPEQTKVIDTANCYLEPGDTIYASLPRVNSSYSSVYAFSEFKVWEYNEDGSRGMQMDVPKEGSNLMIPIPKDFAGTQLSVLPIGEYSERQLSLLLYYEDGDGEKSLSNCTWSVNGEPCTDNAATISPFGAYEVRCDYSHYKENYYVESSCPKEFSHSDNEGIFVFEQTGAMDENTSYKLKLHPYISVTVENEKYHGVINSSVQEFTKSENVIRSILISGREQNIEKAEQQTFSKLKCGDKMVLCVREDYKVSVSGLLMDEPTKVNDGYEYTIVVPDTEETALQVTVSKRTATLGGYEQQSMDHALFTVSHEDGTLLTPGEEVDDNEKVIVTIEAEQGFYVSGLKGTETVYQKVMRYKKYVADAEKIAQEHATVRYIQITLNAKDDYGICTYKVDGKEATGTVQMKDGQTIKLEYTLTNSGYKIVRPKKVGTWIANILSKDKATVSIVVNADMNGKKINRSDYIAVEEK